MDIFFLCRFHALANLNQDSLPDVTVLVTQRFNTTSVSWVLILQITRRLDRLMLLCLFVCLCFFFFFLGGGLIDLCD